MAGPANSIIASSIHVPVAPSSRRPVICVGEFGVTADCRDVAEYFGLSLKEVRTRVERLGGSVPGWRGVFRAADENGEYCEIDRAVFAAAFGSLARADAYLDVFDSIIAERDAQFSPPQRRNRAAIERDIALTAARLLALLDELDHASRPEDDAAAGFIGSGVAKATPRVTGLVGRTPMETEMQIETARDESVLPLLTVRQGRVFANSRDVAKAFEKNHKDVLRAIDDLIETEAVLRERNFAPTQIDVAMPTGGTRKDRAFDMDRDGFALLAMGFTGSKALRWKLAFLEAFNRMEKALAEGLDEDDEDLPTLAHGRLWGQPVAKINAAARMIGVASRIYGPDAARALWERETGLPNLQKFSVAAMAVQPGADAAGCWRHLMNAAAGDGRTIGMLLDLALHDDLAAKALRGYGLALDCREAPGDLAIANKARFLASVFAMTQWNGDWRLAFASLPGARASKSGMGFGKENSRAVIVPRETVLRLRHPVRVENVH